MSTMLLPDHVLHWDDERQNGDGIIVTLKYGRSFDPVWHEGVKGFDTIQEAKSATRRDTYPCKCSECTNR